MGRKLGEGRDTGAPSPPRARRPRPQRSRTGPRAGPPAVPPGGGRAGCGCNDARRPLLQPRLLHPPTRVSRKGSSDDVTRTRLSHANPCHHGSMSTLSFLAGLDQQTACDCDDDHY